MRKITDHVTNGLNEAIEITATDGPGPGGANHCYMLKVPCRQSETHTVIAATYINFQNGPISKPDDVNGLSNEALIAIVIDRMRGFQYGRKEDGTFDENVRGKYACRDNAIALTLLEDALMRLQKRTRDRMARGVEGTHKV